MKEYYISTAKEIENIKSMILCFSIITIILALIGFAYLAGEINFIKHVICQAVGKL